VTKWQIEQTCQLLKQQTYMVENYDKHSRNNEGHCHIHKADYCEGRDGEGKKTCQTMNGECYLSMGKLVNFYDLDDKNKHKLQHHNHRNITHFLHHYFNQSK
jgi:hypothetical protein